MARAKLDTQEIRQRLDEQIELAGWLRRAAEPHDATLFGASPQFKLLAVALATHVGKLRELRGLM
jgi:hypothetical protein